MQILKPLKYFQHKKNVDEIDKKYLKGLNFFYVENILEVVEYALLRKKVSNFKKL